MKPAPGLLTKKETRERIGCSRSAFWEQEKAGVYRHILAKRGAGLRIYSAELLEQWLAGGSTAQFGTLRRAG